MDQTPQRDYWTGEHADQVDAEIEAAQLQIVEALGLDRSARGLDYVDEVLRNIDDS